MNAPDIARIASQSVTPNLTRQLGEELDTAKRLVLELAASFGRLDNLKDKLAEHGMTNIEIDLGEVGNSAFVTHKIVRAAKDRPGFQLPREAA